MSSNQNNELLKEKFIKYKESKDIDIRNELVEDYLYLVEILAKKYINKGVEYDDLYQVGSMALVYAVERYDIDKGFEFTSFATPTIIGEIKRYFRDKGWAVKVPRKLKEIATKIPNVKDKLTQNLERPPTIAEIADEMGETEELILEAMQSGQSYNTYSLQQTFDDSGDEGDQASFERYTGIEEKGYENFEEGDLIKKIYDTLSDKEKEVFKRKFIDEQTQQEIADELEVSQMTISRIEKKIREKFKAEYVY